MYSTFAPVEALEIAISDVTNKPQAHLTQVVSNFYPPMSVGSSTSDSLFTLAQLDVAVDPFDVVRHYFMKVTDAITIDMVEEQLAAHPECRIVRTLASSPMISPEHLSAIAAGLTTEEKIAKSQLVVYGKEHQFAGQAVLHNGIKQYRRFDFKLNGGEDTDLRITPPELIVKPVA